MARAGELYGHFWSEREYELVLDAYFETMGQPRHKNSPFARELAELLGRTPASIYMRIENFASIDPKVTGRRGLVKIAPLCEKVFKEWYNLTGFANARWTPDASRPILDRDEAATILRSMVVALDALHSHSPRIIHRDLNPNNVLLLPNGPWVLADFGFAKFLDTVAFTTTFETRTHQSGWGTQIVERTGGTHRGATVSYRSSEAALDQPAAGLASIISPCAHSPSPFGTKAGRCRRSQRTSCGTKTTPQSRKHQRNASNSTSDRTAGRGKMPAARPEDPT